MIDWHNRTLLAGAAAVLLAGFGIGFLTGKATDSPSAQTMGTASDSGLIGGADTGLFGKPRAANARRAAQSKPAGFDVWQTSLDTSGASPKACIQFSKPLDPSKPYGDYVVVSPALPSAPAVSVKDDTLCVAGIGFNDRRVTLLKGLPGKGMDSLKANKDVDFAFGEKPPYVGFAGNGVILPREESDGVAVETVNVSSLAFEVWHVSDRNLVRKSVSAPEPVGEDEYDYEWGEDSPNDIGVKIWTGKVAVQSGNGERVTTVFPLGAVLKSLKAGAYVIKVKDASGGRDKNDNEQPPSARRWILYTDMALTTYRGQNGMDVVVRSLKTAKPLGGVKVDLVAQNGDTLGTVKTGVDGRVTFNGALLKGSEALQAKMIMAYGPGDDYTAVEVDRTPMDLTSHGIGGRSDEASLTDGRVAGQGVDSYVYTDRGIYRPGETVRLIALMRDNEGRAIKDRKGFLVITRPSGVEAFRLAFDKLPNAYAGGNLTLPKTAPRGQWTAKVVLEGLEGDAGSTTFAVEDFAPQRLGVDLKADANRPLLSLTEVRPVTVAARYLYGANGSGLQVTGEARIRADLNPFPKYQGYQFGDQSKPYEEKYVDLPEVTTDGAGNATIPFNAAEAGETDQPLTVLLTASVFEPGGRPVRESQTLRIKGAPLYLGVRTEQKDGNWRDTPKTGFSLIALNPNGDKVAVPGVKVTLISEIYDYDWYLSDGKWRWRSTHRDVIVDSKTMDLNANTGINFERGLDWGDYRIEVEAVGRAKTVVKFSSGWGSSDKGADSPDSVRVTAGTKTYAQGDTIDLTLKAPYKGEAQIAVATDHVIEMKTVTIGEGGTTVKLKSSAAWGGGAYVMVSVIQPRDPVDSSKPRRAVGLVYIPLDPKTRKLQVNIPLSDQPFKPRIDNKGQGFIDVPVEIKGLKFGDKARVSISVVDQGILNLTKFKSPNPVDWYFGKRALGVDYNDDYGRLLDPNLGAPAKFGGDQLGGEGLTTTPIRTIALWSGVVTTGSNGKAVVHLPIAKFNGELKIMTVAWTDEQVGSSEQRIVVREPVVADLALPRFLSPGDRAFATLQLDNVDGKAGVYEAMVNGLKGIVVAFKKAFNLDRGDKAIEAIALTAPQTVGVSTVQIGLNGQGYAFNDAFNIQTRNGWGPETRVMSQLQNVNEVWAPDASLLSGLQPGSVSVEVSYSPFRNIDPGPLAAMLNTYPYGCTEQVTSAATPWLYVDESMVGKSAAKPAQGALRVAVQKILDRQSQDGAIGLWRVGDGQADGFIGAYATDFLLEARARGVYVPQEAIDKAVSAMRAMAKPEGFVSVNYRLSVDYYWNPYYGISSAEMTKRLRSRASAYALYVMAKAKSGDLARLRWYKDVQFKSEDSPLARAQVAAGLVMMGDRSRGRAAFQDAIAKLGYADQFDWYQSPLRDLAGVIALAYEAGEADIAQSLIPRLEQAMKSPSQMNTIEQAYVLRAASYMLKSAGVTKIEAAGVGTLPGSQHVVRYGVGQFGPVRLKNTGSGPLWRTVTVIGTPVTAPASTASGLSLTKSFYAMDGSRIDPSNLTQGQKVIVVISGRSDRAELRPIVVDDALPAGFEIEAALTGEDAQNGPFRFIGQLTPTKVQEARDDRFIAALDVSSSSNFTLAYIARAVTMGDFYMPGAEAKDFYRTDMFARTQGGRTLISGR
ncbi:alpha-2-macroglobulin family protein [Asticcacaulis biprosthecium C19]|uniref:Alpha-2-macroglobulin family protein n=1 Tax=Asticcacaulis biprosthecium C19 TaxID=715226 RepID=F4QKK9_9CAUL|nr:alpha-2-macroglobulin [Asticcacaulis biprosthecium]EGF92161.1 alpha-2-macroglobulin family protein [Asticcacaulis biprosthecium C19]